MIDKYLRNDEDQTILKKNSNKFLLKRKDDDQVEADYNKYLRKDNEDSLDVDMGDMEGMDNSVEKMNNKFLIKSGEKENDNIFVNPDSTNNNLEVDIPLQSNSPLKLPSNKHLEINELESPEISNNKRREFIEEDLDREIERHLENAEFTANTNNNNQEDYLDQNYLNFESIYLNEGKIKNNIETSMPEKPINTNTIIIPTITSVKQDKEKEKDQDNNNNPMQDQEPENNFLPIPNNTNNNPESYERNEFKLKRLQEKIEEKLRNEFEQKIKHKEREIETKAKTEFEDAMHLLKRELESNLEDEKRKMEDEFKKKWNEKYEDLLVDCKAKLRDDKEQKLIQNMYQKLKPTVEKEIYKKEYTKVEEKIKRELEASLQQQIQAKKMEEVERVKRKLEYFTKVKLEEMESSIKNKCKEEIEAEMKKEVEKKEKEIKTNYLRKFENFKTTLEKQLKDEYESKKKELTKEIDEMKARVYRQKCAEKLKMSKLNNMKKTLVQKERTHLENAEKLEKAIQKQTSRGNSRCNSRSNLNNSKTNFAVSNYYNINNNPIQNQNEDYLYEQDSYAADEYTNNNNNQNVNNFSPKSTQLNQTNPPITHNVIYSNKNLAKITEEIPTSPGRVVNLAELNKKLKSMNPLTLNSDFIPSNYEHHNNRKEVSLIIKESNNNTGVGMNLKENLNNLISKNSKLNFGITSASTNNNKQNDNLNINQENIAPDHDYKLDSPKKLVDRENYLINSVNSINSNFNQNSKSVPSNKNEMYILTNTNNNDEKENPIISNCLSLKINSKVPLSLLDFGKFLVKYIETEENYRILFEKEFKKLRMKIKKAFDDDSTSDHCLMDYITELWDKIEVTYCNRYRIITELSKSKSHEIYQFLDRETEYLTDYFQKSQDIFQMIKNREKLKSKLQFKANRNVLSIEDREKFKQYTNELTRKIKLFKEKNEMGVIWKGLHYDWLINYENWFYENSNK